MDTLVSGFYPSQTHFPFVVRLEMFHALRLCWALIVASHICYFLCVSHTGLFLHDYYSKCGGSQIGQVRLARQLTLLMAVGIYAGNSVKVPSCHTTLLFTSFLDF